jgi:hypothetical protein
VTGRMFERQGALADGDEHGPATARGQARWRGWYQGEPPRRACRPGGARMSAQRRSGLAR